MKKNNITDVEIFSPSLPKGGGSMKGMGENLTTVGSDVMVHFTVPLPVTEGRTITPNLQLSYNSGVGNGAFGIGWQLSMTNI